MSAGPEALAVQLADAQVERDRAREAVEAFDEGVEEKLETVETRRALGEISDDDAAAMRGDLAAEGDGLREAADGARRAARGIETRLVEAAEAAAEAIRAEPVADYEVAERARQKAAEVLAERESDVAEAQAKLAEADTAAEDLRATYIPAAAARRAERANHKKSLIQWAVRNGSRLAVQQLPDAYRAEALAAIDAKAAEAKAIYAQRDAEREFPRIESA